MKQFEPEIQQLNPAKLTPYPLNNKKHTVEQIDELAGLISTFGFDQPIVVDENHIIIKGHCRREAALRLRMALVPVIVRDDLSEEEKRASRIADNAIVGEDWNLSSLGLELESLSKKNFDINRLGLNNNANASLKSFLDARKAAQSKLEADRDDEYHEGREYFGSNGYDGSENESQQSGDASELSKSSELKTIELFFSSTTLAEFNQLVEKLRAKYKVNTVSDCVLECLRDCDD